ncbi:hypothetical protein A3H85_02790 [Candidatus Daviesbacteria bacterium RIFCSPLOWO2_02_FULL_40_8]|uniref:DUF4446 domain-containing protein n=1 Tax=Candidatus Daviesbacteria bacterium RIFCSPLOWO2_01_FULL_40_24 TaxID=1797787 RepID=A0A1F5MIL1_9BACT|nr:MAG: hypothetical protein A2780_03510 [Candidatus Daviesbacteria bacterium RIFCSPHIGHO2_01_FULL_41_45]OGE34211.1 MAG: hypothetical protein A3C32_00595 [Candidatus Daviesbacteria bacterium RIFCSPHIGHO2_02_FULL_41_14]OGE65195.1 MAG: hypothetical protein A3B49_01545 [Candidatus Daviesbacteria bacterium RIFCSPLOWO2_01_FULL_40_24]OGE67118.1 MAG: hypothetical protein A3H85_02790 [Candidatus Daviesbacteria bacterium RIFCSPLOWO2_02_FULL_40_8]
MYPDGLSVLILGGLVVWLLGLTFFVWQNSSFLDKSFKVGSGEEESLKGLLEEVRSLRELKLESLKYLQKVGFKRYNPYKDTGGDQSFSLALLNKKGDGAVITSLHSRNGTRIFAKKIVAGTGEESELSSEESEVIKEAIVK